jgi:tetratricopeptide (TPR) repeat protein
MGYCYRVLGKYNEAKRCYLNSLSINREDTISHYNLANLYRIMGENELAIQEYSYIIDLAESNVSVGSLYINSLINVGICYKNEAQLEEAIRVYQKVL